MWGFFEAGGTLDTCAIFKYKADARLTDAEKKMEDWWKVNQTETSSFVI